MTNLPKLIAASCKQIENGVNVIFIHGFGGNHNKTWRWKEQMQEFDWSLELESDSGFVKVWKYGHRIAPFGIFNETNDIVGASENLIEEIKINKLMDTGNIIFIAHSLGGNIYKKLVNKLMECSKGDDSACTEMLNRIKGVVSLSTPHNGSKFALVAEDIIEKIPSWCFFRFLFNKKIISQLKPHNSFLEELNLEYEKSQFKYNFQHIEFLETNETKIIEYINKEKIYKIPIKIKKIDEKYNIFKDIHDAEIIVEEHREYFDSIGIKPILLQEEHFKICKLKNKNNVVYEKTISFIDNVLKNRNDMDNQTVLTKEDNLV